MLSIEKVLFPVDFSEGCRFAAPYVSDLVYQFRARLDLLHVIEGGSHIAERRRQSATALAAFAGHIPHGVYCPQTVALGDPAEAIVRYAKTHRIDVIAIPYGNGSGPASVTREVLRDATCAVWTGSFAGRPDMGRGPILCAVDLETGSEQILSYASALARNLQSTLIVMHAVPARAAAVAHGSAQSYYAPLALSGNDPQYKLDALLQSTSISAEATVETGPPEEAMVRTAERTGAALLVIGRSCAGKPDGMDVGELIKRSPCPVVFSPRQPSAAECFWTEWQQEAHASETGSSPGLVPELSR